MKRESTLGRVAVMAALAVAIWAVYAPAADFDFVLLDDSVYVFDNPRVLGGLRGDNVLWALRTSAASNWHPLTWLSLMLDAEIGGDRPRVYHLTNVVLHAANALLLFHLLASITRAAWRSAAVAALFALHPLHVESVAWVAERKDVLSTLFWLLACWAYAGYCRRPSARRYLPVLAAFAAGLMAKPMLVTLPFVLLLLDYWPLARFDRGAGRWRGAARLVAEKLPLFALSGASCAVTLWAQQHQVAAGVERFALPLRLANAVVSYGWYLLKTVWPAGLANPYGYDRDVQLWALLSSVALLLAGTWVVLRAARRHPFLPVGWLWYLGTLVPVIGVVQVGLQPRADRYSYVPLIGIFVIVAWGAPVLGRRLLADPQRRRVAVAVATVVTLVALSVASRIQLRFWHDSEALFARALAVDERNVLAHHGMGMELIRRGDVEGSLRHYREAVRLDPSAAFARVNLAGVLRQSGRLEEAVAEYAEWVRRHPDSVEARINLGAALSDLGRYDEAELQHRRALELDPHAAPAHEGLAFALARRSRSAEAIEHLERAAALAPDDAGVQLNLAILWMQERRLEASERAIREALRLQPEMVDAHRRLAMLHALRGETEAAVSALSRALELDPRREDIRGELQRLQRIVRLDAGGGPTP